MFHVESSSRQPLDLGEETVKVRAVVEAGRPPSPAWVAHDSTEMHRPRRAGGPIHPLRLVCLYLPGSNVYVSAFYLWPMSAFSTQLLRTASGRDKGDIVFVYLQKTLKSAMGTAFLTERREVPSTARRAYTQMPAIRTGFRDSVGRFLHPRLPPVPPL